MKKIIFAFTGLLILSIINGWSVKISRFSDGNLTEYFHQPIPKLHQPIATSLSLEVISYQTASNMKGMMVSDLGAREIYFLPKDVGKEVEELLQLDEEFSDEATINALNVIAIGRSKARALHGGKGLPEISAASSGSDQYVELQSQLAKEAYAKGDYLGGDIYNAAAANRLAINAAFGRTTASVNLAFGVLGAMAAAGEAMIKAKFNNLHNWLEFSSGAIGPGASENRNLSIFFFQFFDAERFKLDSRMRIAVLLVLTDEAGTTTSILEGSDLLTCGGKCKLFTPKPTAQLIDHTKWSDDVKKQLATKEGLKYMTTNGFDTLSGIYQYLLLQQGLLKLQMTLDG